jgi:hypothetical protein
LSCLTRGFSVGDGCRGASVRSCAGGTAQVVRKILFGEFGEFGGELENRL